MSAAKPLPIRQVQSRHVEHHAAAAIAQRLGHYMADAVLGSTRERGGSLILHLNSGGNAGAAGTRLRSLGYRVEKTDYDPYAPGYYGVQLRVSPGQPQSETWCAGSGTPPALVPLDRLAFYVAPRGTCSDCGRDMPVRGDGTLRKHKAEMGTPVRPRKPAAEPATRRTGVAK